MTHPDFRALCAELVAYLERATAHFYKEPELLPRARAALSAAPQQGAPSDEDLLATYKEATQKYWDSPDEEETVLSVMVQRGLRAVLTRYGTQPAPVPVAERPWERDGWCNDEGMCWLGDKGTLCDPPAWAFVHRARLIDAASYPSGAESLPHWALPLPEVKP